MKLINTVRGSIPAAGKHQPHSRLVSWLNMSEPSHIRSGDVTLAVCFCWSLPLIRLIDLWSGVCCVVRTLAVLRLQAWKALYAASTACLASAGPQSDTRAISCPVAGSRTGKAEAAETQRPST